MRIFLVRTKVGGPISTCLSQKQIMSSSLYYAFIRAKPFHINQKKKKKNNSRSHLFQGKLNFNFLIQVSLKKVCEWKDRFH